MKRFLAVPILAVFLCAGCGLTTVAKTMKTYRIALGGFQDTETAAFNAGLESQAPHIEMEKQVEILANAGVIADQAIIAGNKAQGLANVTLALNAINAVESNDVTAIGSLTTRAAVEVAVAGLKNLITQAYTGLGGQ